MNKLEVGMYVRTEKGIAKIKKIFADGSEPYFEAKYETDTYLEIYYDSEYVSKYDVLKASFDIIDLIKPKDIILGRDGKLYQCWKIYKDYVFTYSKNKYGDTITLVDYQIDRILTKEQFESMSYRIGE